MFIAEDLDTGLVHALHCAVKKGGLPFRAVLLVTARRLKNTATKGHQAVRHRLSSVSGTGTPTLRACVGGGTVPPDKLPICTLPAPRGTVLISTPDEPPKGTMNTTPASLQGSRLLGHSWDCLISMSGPIPAVWSPVTIYRLSVRSLSARRCLTKNSKHTAFVWRLGRRSS